MSNFDRGEWEANASERNAAEWTDWSTRAEAAEKKVRSVTSYCYAFLETSADFDTFEPEPWNPVAYVLDIVAPGRLAELRADA